jgi:uncharacterized protein with HEPN domain
MPHRLEKLTFDVRSAALAIKSFVEGITHDEFVMDPMRKSAVQMQFVIIGEAMSRLRDNFPETFSKIPEARKIIDFRNVVAHGYDMISDDLVWDVIKNHLDRLLLDMDALEKSSQQGEAPGASGTSDL